MAVTKKYIIYAPKFSKSNGTRALYVLHDVLHERGFDAYIFCPGHEADGYSYIDKFTERTRENDIVVYPEVVPGNPLRFKNVVRYVLFYPGRLGAGEKHYHDSELIFTWNRDYIDARQLVLPCIDRTLFYDLKLKKTQDCYFVHKGGKWKHVPEVEGLIEINMHFPKQRSDLARLLQSTGTLYSFDENSLINLEAKLCGARVLIVKNDGFVECPDVDLYHPAWFESQVDAFVTATQVMCYTGQLERYPTRLTRAIKIHIATIVHWAFNALACILPLPFILDNRDKFSNFLQRCGKGVG